jgi:hypothetical protein
LILWIAWTIFRRAEDFFKSILTQYLFNRFFWSQGAEFAVTVLIETIFQPFNIFFITDAFFVGVVEEKV